MLNKKQTFLQSNFPHDCCDRYLSLSLTSSSSFVPLYLRATPPVKTINGKLSGIIPTKQLRLVPMSLKKKWSTVNRLIWELKSTSWYPLAHPALSAQCVCREKEKKWKITHPHWFKTMFASSKCIYIVEGWNCFVRTCICRLYLHFLVCIKPWI